MADVLFLGNGINRAFNQCSLEELIKSVHEEFGAENLYDKNSTMPFPMRIVVASGDRVDKAMKKISTDMNLKISPEQKSLLKGFLELPVSDILTANYTFELEQTAGVRERVYDYRKNRRFTTPDISRKDEQFGLFKNYFLESCGKSVWHIHGDLTTPSTVIMGNYYYGKLLREIQNYVSNFMKRYAYYRKAQAQAPVQSWVDLFLTNNVYMVGFGLDFSEIDIWWLICCKNRLFPDTKIFFYQPVDDISRDKRLLLSAYRVEIRDSLPFDGDYQKYYVNVINDIKMLKGEI